MTEASRDTQARKKGDGKRERERERERGGGEGTGVPSYETSVQGPGRGVYLSVASRNTPKRKKEGKGGRERGGKGLRPPQDPMDQKVLWPLWSCQNGWLLESCLLGLNSPSSLGK